jgi:hypothetical protein
VKLRRYIRVGDPVAILFEDALVRVFNQPPNRHLLSTLASRGTGGAGVIGPADAVIYEMTHPSEPDRRPAGTRALPTSRAAPMLRRRSAARGCRSRAAVSGLTQHA